VSFFRQEFLLLFSEKSKREKTKNSYNMLLIPIIHTKHLSNS